MEIRQFGITANGETVRAYTLQCGDMRAVLLDRGANLQTLSVHGTDVVLGFDTVQCYQNCDAYIGALVGRYANRIDGGFSLNGRYYPLACNDHGTVHLHGGTVGFDQRIWNAEPAVTDAEGEGVCFTLFSEAGEEGYPGNLSVRVTYLLDASGLTMRYEAQTDADTPLNLTNHAYFELDGKSDIRTHRLQVFADTYAATDARMLVTDPTVSVTDTPLDLRRERRLSEVLVPDDPFFSCTHGIDHNFNLSRTAPGVSVGAATVYPAAVLKGKHLQMTVLTDFPCMQIYTANFLSGADTLKDGRLPCQYGAICFETQEVAADAPNRGQGILHPGVRYVRTTRFSFAQI